MISSITLKLDAHVVYDYKYVNVAPVRYKYVHTNGGVFIDLGDGLGVKVNN